MLDKPRDRKKPRMTSKQFERKMAQLSAKLEKSWTKLDDMLLKADNLLDDLNSSVAYVDDILEGW